MKRERIDLTGMRFGKLTVLSFSHADKSGKAMWLCQCDCGNKKIIASGNLRSGNSKSCGCLHKEMLTQRMLTHGETGGRLYWIWHGMKARCLNPKEPAYKHYGKRGIMVCNEWKNSFEAFRDWAIANGYANNLTIDRIDNNGNYEPSNCRWATAKEQANNKRSSYYITYCGKTQTIKQWADELGINYYTLHSRIVRRGWSVEKAFAKGVG